MAITTITNAMVSVNAIQGTLIADNAITAVHIATNAVSGTLIADNAVTATHIAQNTITVTQLADDAVEADKIADGVITTNHLNSAMISSQTEVTPVAGDFVLLGDTSDSNNLKKAPLTLLLNSNVDLSTKLNLSGGTLTGNLTMGGMMLKPSGDGGSIGFNRNPDNGNHVGDSAKRRFQINGPDDTGGDFLQIQSYNSSGTHQGNINIIDGKLGIGVASPSEELHVSSDVSSQHTRVHVTKTSTAGTAGISFNTTSSANTWTLFQEDASASQFYFYDGAASVMTLDSANNRVGIGTDSPDGPLHIKPASGDTYVYLEAGQADGNVGHIYQNNSGQSRGYILYDTDDDILLVQVNQAEAMRINASGNLLLNSTSDNTGVSGGGIRQQIGSSESDGDKYYVAQGGGSNATPFVLEIVAQNLYDSGTTAMKVGRHSGNQRSISAGGTLNASGADYAEYMKKTDSCGTIAKGDVVGVDADGKLTKTFSAAKSFVIKSTDPSYVGGDTWGSIDLNLTEEEYETERQKYDRIAFSGQVPVNITGSFNVGDYVYPQANSTAIQCVAKSSPTFEEYQLCVGKIWATQSDGRPLVAVKIG